MQRTPDPKRPTIAWFRNRKTSRTACSPDANASRLSLRLGLLLVLLLLHAGPLAAQSQIQYVYDALGRLSAVVDQAGNGAVYTYDAVGNLLSVQRFDPASLPGPVGITFLAFDAGKVGSTIQIFGKGFSLTPGQNTVSFNGVTATVTAATAFSLTVTVPGGATTGPITVTTPSGSGTSPTAFRVLGAIMVSPASAAVATNGTQQFQALDGGTPTSSVFWLVNGLAGGSVPLGTISATGLYRAPAAIPSGTITVTAISKDDATLQGSASVSVLAPQPVTVATRGLSISVAAPPPTIERSLTAAVSVGVAPVITAISPSVGARGATNLLVTLTGAGLSGTTSVAFLLNNAVDADITSANPTVNAAGTEVTVQVAIAAGAAVGLRVLRVTTPGGSSTAVGTTGNVFSVQ